MKFILKLKKKTIALICVVTAMIVFFTTMYIRSRMNKVGGLATAAPEHTFSYFISQGVSSVYYTDYAENPGVQYWCGKQFDTENGEKSNVAFNFKVAPEGEATNTLTNLLGNKSTWPDIVDSKYSSMSAKDAYEAGYIIDLTPYIDECMPNFKAMLERYNIVEGSKEFAGGEWRNLGLGNFQDLDLNSNWGGYQYRRDWIIKYGTPVPGSQAEKDGGFKGYYAFKNDGTPCEVSAEDFNSDINGDSWQDNVTFPSWERRNDPDGANGGMKWYADWCAENGKTWDGSHPVTISDWEWMFGFFDKAIKEQNIKEGYVHSLYYPGYIENGDFVTGFGGIGAHFYWNDQDRISFGAMEPGFKAYLRCMNSWWKNGWLDKEFNTKSNMSFYQIDDDLVRQGRIGCWYGTLATIGNRIDKSDLKYTNGAIVSTAASPINDVYDDQGNAIKEGRALSEEVSMHVPSCFYGASEYSVGGLWFSTNILEQGKDFKHLLRAFDWLYSEEGSRFKAMGLSKEQLKDKDTSDYVRTMYEKYGMKDGSYETKIADDGTVTYLRNNLLNLNSDLTGVIVPNSIAGYGNKKNYDYGFVPQYTSVLEQFNLYKNDRFMSARLVKYETTDAEKKLISDVYSRITTTFLYQEIPRFIKGTRSINKSYESVIVKGCIERGVQEVIDFNNRYLDEMDYKYEG